MPSPNRAAGATSGRGSASPRTGISSSPSGTAATGTAPRTRGTTRGSIVRLRDDGTVPPSNPFVGVDGARPDIYTIGHRNVQGLAFHPRTGVLWAHEHGPRGGDEVNVVRARVNYGWPVISYGREYAADLPVGEGTHREGMAQPALQWTPSIAPSGLTVYDGDRFPGWRGNLFAGALRFQLLARLVLDGERIVHEERLLEGRYGRIRDVRTGPDGLLYLLTDAPAPHGALLRLEPAARRIARSTCDYLPSPRKTCP